MTSQASDNLPATFKGLQFSSATEPPSIVELPTPTPAAGSVILRPLYSSIPSYSKDVFCNGNPRGYNYPLPMVPGTDAICRIAAPAPDTPHLKPGMLVFASGVVRPRDNSSALPSLQGILMGASLESEAIMKGEWRNGCWAEFVKVPAENVHVLNERILIKKLDYNIEDLGFISTLAVAYGGLSDIGLKPGETVIVAPATGNFGSAAVLVALAMGAGKVIAMGRSQEKLQDVLNGTGGRVAILPITGDVGTDTAAVQAHGPIDVYFDISPHSATKSSHIAASISALRPKGRMCIMGGIQGDISFPYHMLMFKRLTIQGTFMYTREQVDELIRLVETGILPIGKRGGVEVTGKFSLGKWEEAFQNAHEQMGPRKAAYFIPNEE
ncbi:alcohol dehydrogenase GroES domain-containing protein [Dactylonectria estremocensis]|uniref:Alcohol dehydrogenase GroES domain-containing protein n=1 Tax=Dactylonectria estremocensis TaxID=1079267 RepID=A0A9P9ISH6_9HYPO|nr:alcohol dehydrogenase GroES domain-containing protein [Dactylonectria estremocensis]